MKPVADQDQGLRTLVLPRGLLPPERGRGDRLFPEQVLDVFGGGLSVSRPGIVGSGQQDPFADLFQREAQADPVSHLAAQLGQITHLAAQQILSLPASVARNHPLGPKPLQFSKRSHPGQGVPAHQLRPRTVDDHPARKQDPLPRQVDGCRCGFQAVVAGDRFNGSWPLPHRDFSSRPGNLHHLNAPRLERPQRLVFRVRFTGEQQRADRLRAGSGNCRQEGFGPDPRRQVNQHRPILQLDPTAVGGAVTVGEAGQVDTGSDLLHEIQGSSRATARGHKETSDQWTKLNSHFSPGRWIHYGTTFFFSTLLALF